MWALRNTILLYETGREFALKSELFIHHSVCSVLLSSGTVIGPENTAVDETWTSSV